MYLFFLFFGKDYCSIASSLASNLRLVLFSFIFISSVCFLSREEKSEQLLDTRQELENMEVELKKLQQEVTTQVTAAVTRLRAHTTILPSSVVSPRTQYLGSAALPGFNQLASDLAH